MDLKRSGSRPSTPQGLNNPEQHDKNPGYTREPEKSVHEHVS